MKKLKYYPVTNYNKFPQKYYFLSIIKEIIKIANLINTQKKIDHVINVNTTIFDASSI